MSIIIFIMRFGVLQSLRKREIVKHTYQKKSENLIVGTVS